MESSRHRGPYDGSFRMRERFTLAEVGAGVGRSRYYERKRRLPEEGVKGLVPRGSRPKSHRGRQWTKADAKRVLEVRREKPWAGKAILVHDVAERWPEHALSEATVGRILHWAVEAGKRLQQPAPAPSLGMRTPAEFATVTAAAA